VVPSTRRRVLAAVPAVALGAGCTGGLPAGDATASPTVGLGGVRVLNFRAARTTVDVSVRRDGRSVYDRAHTLDGHEGNQVDAVDLSESWMGQTVPYEVTVTARDPRTTASFSTADAEQFVEDWGDDSCFRVDFDVTDERVRTALGGMDDCPSASASASASASMGSDGGSTRSGDTGTM
jgi:hypothetical protein